MLIPFPRYDSALNGPVCVVCKGSNNDAGRAGRAGAPVPAAVTSRRVTDASRLSEETRGGEDICEFFI